jgi:hypothetical protein
MLFDIPKPTPAPENPVPNVKPKEYKNSIVESAKTPIATILSFIGGSNWYVHYYSQIFGKSEELKAFDPSALTIYQTYHKVNRLILKLQGALNPDDDTGTGRQSLTGSAIITPHPNLIPNVYDAFIADIGDGRAGQFSITSVRKMSAMQNAAWSIEFKLEREADERITALIDSRVVQESYYDKNYLITGQNPLLAKEDYLATQTLKEHYKRITAMFVSKNYSYATATITVPLQDVPTYDPFVVRAALALIDSDDTKLLNSITAYNCDDHRIPKQTDIYTAIIQRDYTLLYGAFNQFACLSVGLLKPSAYQNSVRYSGIRSVVVPYQPTLDNDIYTNLNDLIATNRLSTLNPGLQLGDNSTASTSSCGIEGCIGEQYNPYLKKGAEQTNPTDGLEPGMDIPTIGNASYIVSTAFYNEDLTKCSLFEIHLWNILRGKPVDRAHLYAFCECYPKWGRLEQYYLGPLLLAMIRYTLREI